MYDIFEQHSQESDPREAWIDKRVGRFCDQGMDYWQAVRVAEKQYAYIQKWK